MKIIESFKADKYGFLDRTSERDKRISLDNIDKKTIEAVEESGTYGKLILASFDYVVNKIENKSAQTSSM